MVNEDMPFFRQFPNACGLTSLLMILKPASRKIDELLNYGWDKVGAMFGASPKETQEFHWQRILEYLLTACTQHPAIRAYLEKEYPDFTENIRPWLQFALLGEKAQVANAARPNLLQNDTLIMQRVRTMKHDVELKILAFLFGCHFIPWEKCTDGTGAVFFSRDELLEKRKGHEAGPVEEKLAFIKKGITGEGLVLWGASYHWLAASDLREDEGHQVLFYHDPMGGGNHSINVTAFRETDRFYVFKFDAKLLEEHESLVKQAFDIPEPSPKIILEEATEEEKLPETPKTIQEVVEAEMEKESGEGEENDTGDSEFSDEELLKIEAFAKKVKTLQDTIDKKDKQLVDMKAKIAKRDQEIKELKQKLGKSPQ